MTDRELLELAAKAAGYEFVYVDDLEPHIRSESGGTEYWNPLTDDGDALRLAVKLKLTVRLMDYECAVSIPGGGVAERTTMGYGLEEATRRAIVRAAAEIGKSS